MANEETKKRKQANKNLHTFTSGYYFEFIPNVFINNILVNAGFKPLEDGIYCGRDGSVHEQVGDRTWFTMTWHKMEVTGNYEIVAYVS